MSNEDFQKIVLQKLSSLETDITDIKTDLSYVKKKIDVIEEQTKNLTEFKTVVKEAGEILYKKIV